MANTNLLKHLLRSGITPSFSFPLDVAVFRGEGSQNFKPKIWPNMDSDLKQALSTYSAGKVLTVDGEEYQVKGLYIYESNDRINKALEHFSQDIGKERLKYYNRCIEERCGWVSNIMDKPNILDKCPICEVPTTAEAGIKTA